MSNEGEAGVTRSVEIPEAAVEAGAKAYYDYNSYADVEPDWSVWAAKDGEEAATYRNAARIVLTAALPYLAPAGDGGLREALEKKLATTDGWAVANETLLDMLAAHPAAPAVPQPAEVSDEQIDEHLNRVIEFYQPDEYYPEFQHDKMREAYRAGMQAAVPQPVDREALERVIEDTFDEIEREFGDEGPPMETLIGQLADAVLAVLAGEQEQVEK